MINETQIAPGIYKNGDEIRFDIQDLLKAAGWVDTPESRAAMEETAKEAATEMGLGHLLAAEIMHVHRHNCPRCHSEFRCPGRVEKCIKPKFAVCGVCRN